MIKAKQMLADKQIGEYTLQSDGYTGEDRAFVKALQGDRSEVYNDYEEGVKSLAVSVAVAKSAEKNGCVVKVAEIL